MCETPGLADLRFTGARKKLVDAFCCLLRASGASVPALKATSKLNVGRHLGTTRKGTCRIPLAGGPAAHGYLLGRFLIKCSPGHGHRAAPAWKSLATGCSSFQGWMQELHLCCDAGCWMPPVRRPGQDPESEVLRAKSNYAAPKVGQGETSDDLSSRLICAARRRS